MKREMEPMVFRSFRTPGLKRSEKITKRGEREVGEDGKKKDRDR